jgi:formate dehydrogenase major subunit
MNTITLTIDGVAVTAKRGMTILEAAKSAGIYIPTLCYDPDLKPSGVCRICIVEVGKRGGLLPACRTPAEEGMVVTTDSPEVEKIRRLVVELIVVNHPVDCMVCSKSGQCELQKIVAYLGIEEKELQRLRRATTSIPIDTSNPFFDRDLNKCVFCTRCVRVCQELVGVSAIDLAFRGYSGKVSTFGDKPLVESRCVSCGECLIRCPVGALIPKNVQHPTREVKTICSYCGVGCGIYLGVRGGVIVNVRGDPDNPVNKGNLCVKGRFGHGYINHPERLTSPLIKRDGEFVEATWEEALDLVASKLASYKSDQFAVISSAKCTNEENYVIQKFARAVIGTNNIDHCARL